MEINWRADFDLCTILMLILFWAIYRDKKRFQSLTGKMFEIMFVHLFLCTVIEYIEIYFSHIMPIATPVIKCILLCAYQLLISMLCFIFSIYVFLVARKGIYSKGRWYWYVGYVPALLTLISIVTTPFTHLIFYFENGSFMSGPLYFGIYIVIAAYMVFAAIVLIIYRNNLIRRNLYSLFVFLICMACGMIYQAITVGGLVTNFLAALGLILIYFSQQSNYDKIDAGSNLYNRHALLIYINELINSGQNFRVVALAPDQLLEILHSKGSFYTDAIIRQIGDRLRELYGSTGTYSLGSGRFAIVTPVEWKLEIKKRINESLEKPYMVGNESFDITTSGCYLQYPGDFETADMALEMIARGMDIATKTGGSILVTIDNYDNVRDSLIARLKQEQAALEREKKEAEQAKETAESSDKAKSTFLAHMSHEIRTPLTTIMGMTEILLRGELSDNARGNVESIYSAGKSLLQIINDILDFSKIEAGRMEIVEEPFEVVPTIESAINVLRVRCDSKPIEIVTDIDKQMPTSLMGDETRIKQVLFNLLSNAAKYTDAGTITFTLRWDAEASGMFVSVKDTGRGIREGDMNRLFQSFSRFDAHANKAIEGTGLGLAITKRMIELMGGELKVESTYGEGSCFSFMLKHKIVDATPIGEAMSGSHARKSFHGSEMKYFTASDARVLVVDDNSFNRTIAEELMRPHLISVDQAESGPECLEKVAKNSYDMIFLDHMMPGMDGIETMKRLLELPEYINDRIPVVAFTANAISGMKESFNAAGFSDFLSKPIEVDALEAMLANYLPKNKLHIMSKEEFNLLLKDSGSEQTSGTYDMSEVEIEGVDIEVGLASVGGNVSKYFKLINVILNDKAALRARLVNEFETEDIENYTIDVHALKSNLASIGAVKASELAKSLEYAGRRNSFSFIKANHETMMNVHASICEGLAKAAENYEKWCNREPEQISENALAALGEMVPDYADCLSCVRLLIDECEYDTAIRLAGLFGKLLNKSEECESFAQIADKLEMFDYDGASELIEAAGK